MDALTALPLQTEGLSLPIAGKAVGRLLPLKPTFARHDIGSPQRQAVQEYVGQQFERTYSATLTEFMPELFSMRCRERISAVAGIRRAHHGDLFVEQYLDESIEQAISRIAPAPVARASIVEVGNLTGTHRGATLLFFVIQAAILHEAGFRWAVFAATRQVEKILNKLDFETLDLGTADPARLGKAAAQWGRYYETSPNVCAADIAATITNLRQSHLPAAVMTFFSDTITDLARTIRIQAFQ